MSLLMEATNVNQLQQLYSQAEQAHESALKLEKRYRTQSSATDETARLDSNDTDSNDDDIVMISPMAQKLESKVKIKLLRLIGTFEECINESETKCAINFNYSKYEFEQLFEIWTKIRKVYDIVKYASVWDVTSPNDGEPTLEDVYRQISETFLQHLFKAQLSLFNEAVRNLSYQMKRYINFHNDMERRQLQQQYQACVKPDLNADPKEQQIYQQFDYLLDFFRDSVDRVKNGSLSVWRREQKKAMLGIGLKADMTQDLSVTRPAIALKNATYEFQEMAKIWKQIDWLLHMIRSNNFFDLIVQKSWGCLQHLLQSSLVVDWRYEGLCQPHIVVRQGCGERVMLIVKILAATGSFTTPDGSFLPLINATESNLSASFVKPSFNAVALSEETAIKLRDNQIDDQTRMDYIERAGNITHMKKARGGVLQTVFADNPDDKTVDAHFDEIIFVLKDEKRKKENPVRNATTKYHVDIAVTVAINSAMAQMTPIFYLKTLSTPFSYSVGNMQDKKLYRAFVWNLLGSHPDSVNCHCQPLVRDSEDLSLVYWGDYKEALKWLFYKLTRSRVLHDDELQHLGNRLFANNEFSNSKTFSPQRGEPSWPGFSQIRMLQSDQKSSKGKKNKYASLFYWYFEAIDLIIDRQASMKRSRDQPRGPELSMANLFQTGMLLGFISRSESEKLLRASDRNAMLIRFSDHFCGHITVSYIEKKTDGSPDKVEHVRPLTRSLLAGMGLPMMIAVLINLTNVKHIITARLSPGQTTLSDEDYTWKQDLIKNHLDHYEDGIYSQSEGDKYTYASRLMLKVQKTRRDASQAAEAASPLSNMQTSRYSPQTPATDRFDNQLDTLFEQFRNHPRVLQLTEELAQNAKRNDAISPSESSRNSHTEPSSSTTPATTFIQQNPILPSQHPPMPMPFPSAQRQSSFQPTLQMAMQYQPTNPATMPFQSNNGVQMMLPQQQQQQQPMMMQGGQQSQWNVHPQAQHSSANVMQGYNQPQQIQMELQQMTIGSQQQQRTFTSPVNQFPQPQGMMQQSPLSHTGHQQVVGQHASQSQNAQAQIMPQQQMSSSSSYVQQPQQGMMQSSFGYQPQQQYYPQYQSQPGTFMQQPFGGNMQTLQQQQQPQMLPNFQSNAQIPYLRNVDDR